MKTLEINSSEIIDRMKKICNVQLDKDLADIVGIAASSVVSWRKRSVPLENLMKIAISYDVSIDYLLWGVEQGQQLSQNEKMFLMAFNSLNDDKKLQLMGQMMGLNSQSDQKANISQSSGDNGINVAGNATIQK